MSDIPKTVSRPFLRRLIFEVTHRCNHLCAHCYNIWHPKSADLELDSVRVDKVDLSTPNPSEELDTPQTLGLLDKVLTEVTCARVTLTGGEPLLRRDLPDIVDFLAARGIRINLITNGSLLTPERIHDLIGRGVGLIQLPLLSTDRQVHDRLSGRTGAFDAVVSALAHIRLAMGRSATVFVITRQNADQALDVIKLSVALGAQSILFNRFNVGGRGRQNAAALMPTIEQLERAFHVADDAVAEYGIPIACSIPVQPCLIDSSRYPRLSFGHCAAGTDRAYYTMDPIGNLRPCNHTPTILGNLRERLFSELLEDERLSKFVKAHPDLCDGCEHLSRCLGGCKAAGEVFFGTWSSPDPFLHANRDRCRR